MPGGRPTGPGAESVILEEEIDENYEPTTDEILEYAKWLGMDAERENDLMWLAREGLKAPLPDNWKPCKSPDGEIYYFNFSSGESVWDHPCDEYYKKLYSEEKAKLEARNAEKELENRKRRMSESQKSSTRRSAQDVAPLKMSGLQPLGNLSSRALEPLRSSAESTLSVGSSHDVLGGKIRSQSAKGRQATSAGDVRSEAPVHKSKQKAVALKPRESTGIHKSGALSRRSSDSMSSGDLEDIVGKSHAQPQQASEKERSAADRRHKRRDEPKDTQNSKPKAMLSKVDSSFEMDSSFEDTEPAKHKPRVDAKDSKNPKPKVLWPKVVDSSFEADSSFEDTEHAMGVKLEATNKAHEATLLDVKAQHEKKLKEIAEQMEAESLALEQQHKARLADQATLREQAMMEELSHWTKEKAAKDEGAQQIKDAEVALEAKLNDTNRELETKLHDAQAQHAKALLALKEQLGAESTKLKQEHTARLQEQLQAESIELEQDYKARRKEQLQAECTMLEQEHKARFKEQLQAESLKLEQEHKVRLAEREEVIRERAESEAQAAAIASSSGGSEGSGCTGRKGAGGVHVWCSGLGNCPTAGECVGAGFIERHPHSTNCVSEHAARPRSPRGFC